MSIGSQVSALREGTWTDQEPTTIDDQNIAGNVASCSRGEVDERTSDLDLESSSADRGLLECLSEGTVIDGRGGGFGHLGGEDSLKDDSGGKDKIQLIGR